MPSPAQPSPQDVIAFLSAAANGNITTVRNMLGQFGPAIINENEGGYDPNDPFHTGQGYQNLPLHGAALLQAAYYGHTDVVTLLLEEGANINIQSKYSWTALMLAARQGNFGAVEQLLKYGADTEIIQTEQNCTALDFARRLGRNEITDMILNKPAALKERISQAERRKEKEQAEAAKIEERIQKLRDARPKKPLLKKTQRPGP